MKNEDGQKEKLYNLLGDLPVRKRPISSRLVSREQKNGFWLEKLMLDLNGLEEVPAYFLLPKNARKNIPAILYNHAHGGRYGDGKDELINGAPSQQKPPYAETLTKEGYAVLTIDAWNFGERSGRTELELFKEMLWKGRVLWGMMVYDSIRAVDYLISRPEVDKKRLGTVGMSMGSTMAWWIAALDVRIKVCVDICCLSDFQTMVNNRTLDQHGIYYYVPNLLKEFDTVAINSLIAPRPHLGLAGNLDLLTPPEGLDKIDAGLKKIYADQKASNAWSLIRYNVGHKETAAMRQEVIAFFRKWL
ncbi:MAG: acetylxylan esterase [Candidatus Omnitrophota bacterium]